MITGRQSIYAQSLTPLSARGWRTSSWIGSTPWTPRIEPDLRELNELDLTRFDAKLDQRLTELNPKWGTRWTALDAKVDRRLAAFRTELVSLRR